MTQQFNVEDELADILGLEMTREFIREKFPKATDAEIEEAWKKGRPNSADAFILYSISQLGK